MTLPSALVALALAAAPVSAFAQDVPVHPPVAPELPSRVEQQEASTEVRQPKDELQKEKLRADGAGVIRSGGQVLGVDSERGILRLQDTTGVHDLHAAPDLRVYRGGQPAPGLQAVAPGDEVRATFTPGGSLKSLDVNAGTRDEGATVPSTPGARPNLGRKIPQNQPNPSAPEPQNDRAPGDVPGNHIPW